MSAAVLDVDGIVSGYGEAEVIRRISLAVDPGEVVVVLGKNGMGKSTFLKSLMGFLPKRAGAVAMLGHDVTSWAPHRIARLGVAYVAQEQALFPELAVEENIRLAMPRGRSWPECLARVERLFPFLVARLQQRAGTLSGGEQKMLLVARAISSGARLLLIDEISEGLQPSVIQRLAGTLKAETREAGLSILMIEQNLPFALAVAHRYAVLERGELVESGSTETPISAQTVAAHLTL